MHPVGKVHHVDDSGFRRGIPHLRRVLVIHGQGLLAKHVFAGGQDFQGERVVEGVRGHDGDRVTGALREQLVHVRIGLRDLILFGEIG